MRRQPLLIGALAVLAGATFLLQGIGFLPGSYMTGDPKWAWIGGAIALSGLGLLAWGRRSVRR